jgi:hypothetical protein
LSLQGTKGKEKQKEEELKNTAKAASNFIDLEGKLSNRSAQGVGGRRSLPQLLGSPFQIQDAEH